jgi:hypothetical protein
MINCSSNCFSNHIAFNITNTIMCNISSLILMFSIFLNMFVLELIALCFLQFIPQSLEPRSFDSSADSSDPVRPAVRPPRAARGSAAGAGAAVAAA